MTQGRRRPFRRTARTTGSRAAPVSTSTVSDGKEQSVRVVVVLRGGMVVAVALPFSNVQERRSVSERAHALALGARILLRTQQRLGR
eukprot:scaffold90111_cov76-Phaeocystis_antarctica.AAC.6